MYTDIVAYFDSKKLTSFNVNGSTVVYISELAEKSGAICNWSESERTVYFYSSEKEKTGIGFTEAKRERPAKITEVTRKDSQKRWGEPSKSNLIANDDGTYFAVEIDEHINIERYDKNSICN